MREDRIVRNEALCRELDDRVREIEDDRFVIVEKLEGERELALSDPRS